MMNKELYNEYTKGIALAMMVITTSEEQDVRMEGAEIATLGLREMYDQIGEENQDEAAEYIAATLVALAIMVQSEDDAQRTVIAAAIMSGLLELREKVF